MRMCRQIAALCLTVVIAGVAHPDSVARSEAADERPGYTSPTAAYDVGLSALQKGDTAAAVRALDFAAGEGLLDAQLRLAEIYGSGDGVKRNRARSFSYYQRIASQFADAGPRHPVAAQVATAYVALGDYYRTGIEEQDLKPNPARAATLYRHAASFFGSVEAQYNLARMYLAGEGVNKNVRVAVNWLANATRKQHAPSQALLGDLLWRGVSDSYHQPLKGLALLKLAHERAVGTADAEWIDKLYAQALAQAQPDQKEQARQLATHWSGGSVGTASEATETALSAARPVSVETAAQEATDR